MKKWRQTRLLLRKFHRKTAEGRRIDIESISGDGISSLAFPFQKPGMYVVVSVNGHQKQHTPTDPTGSKNPRWLDLPPMRFDLDGSDQVVDFRLMARGNLLLLRPGKHVGELRVPLSALVAESAGRALGSLCHVSYQVRTPAGKPNGVLTFAYRISFPQAGGGGGGGGYTTMPLPPPTPPFGYYPSSSPVYVVQMMPPGGPGYPPHPLPTPQSAGTYYQPMMQALPPQPQYGYRP